MLIARQRCPSIGIDMTPMIDCVFQLLIFFLLSSTYLSPKIMLSLPKASGSVSVTENEFLVVTVDVEGTVYLNSVEVTWSQLPIQLTSHLQRSHKDVVTLRCDAMTPHKFFVRALDIAKTSGARHVNVAHDIERDETR
jgi:biopolymer transport protein ExbD